MPLDPSRSLGSARNILWRARQPARWETPAIIAACLLSASPFLVGLGTCTQGLSATRRAKDVVSRNGDASTVIGRSREERAVFLIEHCVE